MTGAVIVTDERVARFVSDELGCGLCPPYTCMGVEKDGEIIGGVIFNVFEGKDIHVTVAGTGWDRKFLIAVGEYVFWQLGCNRMTITTNQDRVVNMAVKMGGEIEGRLRKYYPDGREAIIVGILAEDYKPFRWLKTKH